MVSHLLPPPPPAIAELFALAVQEHEIECAFVLDQMNPALLTFTWLLFIGSSLPGFLWGKYRDFSGSQGFALVVCNFTLQRFICKSLNTGSPSEHKTGARILFFKREACLAPGKQQTPQLGCGLRHCIQQILLAAPGPN